jgi:hypothetical protein
MFRGWICRNEFANSRRCWLCAPLFSRIIQRKRCLALSLFLLGITLARADEAEDKAAKYITDLGGKVVRDENAADKPVIKFDVTYQKFNDAGMKEV